MTTKDIPEYSLPDFTSRSAGGGVLASSAPAAQVKRKLLRIKTQTKMTKKFFMWKATPYCLHRIRINPMRPVSSVVNDFRTYPKTQFTI